jgi:hypothetical protein
MMNINFWILLCGLLASLVPPVCLAGSNIDLIEQLPVGCINWTRGVVTAKGKSGVLGQKEISQPNAVSLALKLALFNIQETIDLLRVSNCSSVAGLIAAKANEYRQVKEMAMDATVVGTTMCPDGSIEVSVQMPLSGGFAQLVLPGTIRQVEPIKPLTSKTDHLNLSDAGPVGTHETVAVGDTYTGLIVDARGIGVKPSMVPVIVDEGGQEVYGPEYVSREFAVQHGICQYVTWGDALLNTPRVAPNPLIIKGLTVTSDSCSEIVVSNADASKLRGSSLHLSFLKQCRVIIALDEKRAD